eukprot:scaffold1155_cov95-Cylindrotheca_fusiformis.AAC.1
MITTAPSLHTIPSVEQEALDVGDKDLGDKPQTELTILAPTRKKKGKRTTNERMMAKWANVTWAKVLGNSQDQVTRDVTKHRADQQVRRI